MEQVHACHEKKCIHIYCGIIGLSVSTGPFGASATGEFVNWFGGYQNGIGQDYFLRAPSGPAAARSGDTRVLRSSVK